MNEYPVGSICEVIDASGSKYFTHMLGEIVTITSRLRSNRHFPDVFVYDVNERGIEAIDDNGDEIVFTPRHSDLKLIRPPSSEKGLELILGMFPKVTETV